KNSSSNLKSGGARNTNRAEGRNFPSIFLHVDKTKVTLLHSISRKQGRIKILGKLLPSALFVFLAPPDFKFDDEFFLAVGYDKVHAAIVSCPRFDIIKPRPIDYRFEETQENKPSLLFGKRFIAFAILLPHKIRELGYDIHSPLFFNRNANGLAQY
ncbi:MAG: hypothetical protein IJV54_15130, partial [Bacteroidales bacterium]|nr:hypothetical protein [Bacteroidales bacterium]